ncbi:hypothetical protein B0H13DRAFT_1613873 [Mycena leptocephala]|nr:hypothetical protein B0H13DRAFT_1613873 [Mycena leptocephala]
MHHIVDCRKFEGWRTEAGVEVTTRTERNLLAILDRQSIYTQLIPRTDDLITPALIPETIKRRKLSVELASDWHTSSIRLAGRIFGNIQCTMAARAAGTTS